VRKNPDRKQKLCVILQDHAIKTNTQSDLIAARQGPLPSRRRVKERLVRVQNHLSSFRLSARQGSENTILTAAKHRAKNVQREL
jgi:hypothetical protein